MEDLLHVILSAIIGEALIQKYARKKIFWASLFFGFLIAIQGVFMLITLLIGVYERLTGVTNFSLAQFAVEFFKFHLISIQPASVLVISAMSFMLVLGYAYHYRQNMKNEQRMRSTKEKTPKN